MKTAISSFSLSLAIAASAVLSACGGGGGGTTASNESNSTGGAAGTTVPAPSTPPSTASTYTASSGVAQKGPLILGSTVTAQELNGGLSPVGKQYSYQINSNLGSFNPTSTFSSQYLGVNATGYYFDEVQNVLSTGAVTLNGYSDLSVDSVLNVNLLTTLSYQRIQNLITNSGMGFSAARAQAETEVLAALNIRNISTYGSFSTLDLAKSRDADNALAAISSLFVNGNTPAQLNLLISSFQKDIADNGLIDTAATKTAIVASGKSLLPVSVASNLTVAYSSLGLNFTAISISNWIDQVGDGVIGKYRLQQTNATPSSAYTSSPYVAGSIDSGKTFAASAGVLAVNGVARSGPVAVKAGDSLTLTLVAGTGAGDIVSSYLSANAVNVEKFTVQTQTIKMVASSTLANTGIPYDLALSADSRTLFVAAFDSRVQSSSLNDGGLYAMNVANPSAPAVLSLSQYPAPGYITASGYKVRLSGNYAYVATPDAQFQIINVANPASPILMSTLPTNCQAFSLGINPSQSMAFVTTTCGALMQINISNPSSPTVTGVGSPVALNPASSLVVSPDGLQIALGGLRFASVVDFATGVQGNSVDISSVLPLPQALEYLGNETLLLVSPNGMTVANTAKLTLPVVIGQVAFSSKATGSMPGGVAYMPSSQRAYVAIGNTVSIVDLRNLALPVIRGSITLSGGSSSLAPQPSTGIAVSSDEKTIYVVYNNKVQVITVGN